MAIDENKIITLDNIFSMAQDATSIGDGDYFYIFKAGAGVFSRIEKSIVMQGINNAGGINASVYECIKNNVDALQAKVDEIVDAVVAMANYTFPNGKPVINKVGSLDWVDAGGDASSDTPRITLPSSSSINVGTIVSGDTVSKQIIVQAQNLTLPLNIEISGSGSSYFSLSASTISVVEAEAGKSITITFTNNVGDGSTKTATLTISSSEVSKTISLSATSASSGDVTQYRVSAGTLENCSISQLPNGMTVQVANGGNWSGTIVTDSGFARPATIQVSGTYTNMTYDRESGAFNIYGIGSDISISATANGYVENGLVMHLDYRDADLTNNEWESRVNTTKNGETFKYLFGLSNVAKTNNGLVFNGVNSKAVCEQVLGVPINQGTIEFVIEQSNTMPNLVVVLLDATNSSQHNISAITWNYDNGNYVGISRNAKVDGGERTIAKFANSSSLKSQYSLSEDNSYSEGSALSTKDVYADVSYHSDMVGKMMIGCFVSSSTGDERFSEITIKSLRVYNRKLTASEIMQNYEVDVAQFNLE